MTVQEHPNDEEFRPVRAASDALDAHLTSAIAELSQEKPTVTAPQPGNFASQIRGMLDQARADLEAARNAGLAKVGGAIEKMRDAQTQTQFVTAGMAKTIEDEAAAVLAELGQISNFPPA
jgi:hypothetical protein